MNIKKIEKQIQKKLDQHLASSTNYLAAAAKVQRERKGLTQVQIETNACHSNNSKFERQKAAPSDYFIEETGQALGLPLRELKQRLEKGNVLDEAINAFYQYDYAALEAILEDVKRLNLELIDDIYTLFISVLSKDVKESEPIVQRCLNNIINMDYFSAIFVSLLSAFHYYYKNDLKKANGLLSFLEKGHAFNAIFSILCQELKCKINLKFDNLGIATHAYHQILDLMKSNFQATRFFRMHLCHIELMAQESITKAQALFNALPKKSMDRRTINHYYYVYALMARKTNTTIDDDFFNYLVNDENDSYYYKTLISANEFFGSKTQKKVEEIFKKIPGQFTMEKVMFTLNNKSEEAYIEYMHFVALPMAIRYGTIKEIKTFSNVLISEKIKQNRYKEAISIRQKCIEALEALQQV